MKLRMKQVVTVILSLILMLSIAFLSANEQSFAATKYVTLDGNMPSTLNGGITVYKDSGCNTPWKYNSTYTSIMSKNVYMEYIRSISSYCYEVKFGNSKGYVLQSKTKLTSLPSKATKLSNRKKVTVGVHNKLYVPFNTYVVYTDASTGKVAWANYCNSAVSSTDPDKWVYSPYAFAYLSAI